MRAALLALAVLLAPACAGSGVSDIAAEQSRYDVLDPAGRAELASARRLLDSGHALEAQRALEALSARLPECVWAGIWLQEAEVSALGLDLALRPAAGRPAPTEEQLARADVLRRSWRARAEASAAGPVAHLLAARLESDGPAARLLLDEAARRDPRCAWVPYARAFLAARDNEWTAVARELERARQLDPGHLPTRWLEAWTLARGGDPHQAREALEAWLERAQDDERIDARLVREAELDRAVLAVLDGEPKTAREWLDRIEGELSEPARRLCARACAEEALGRPERALELAQKAAAEAPGALLPLVQQALLWQHWKKDPLKAEVAWKYVLASARSSPELGALFERLRSRVELERGARAAAAATKAP